MTRPLMIAVPVVVIALLFLLATADRSAAGGVTRPAAVDRDVTFVGEVRSWRISSDGGVAFKLLGSRSKADGEMSEPTEVWFATPPNLRESTQFPNLVVQALLHGTENKWTVLAEADTANMGVASESAMQIMSIDGHSD